MGIVEKRQPDIDMSNPIVQRVRQKLRERGYEGEALEEKFREACQATFPIRVPTWEELDRMPDVAADDKA